MGQEDLDNTEKAPTIRHFNGEVGERSAKPELRIKALASFLRQTPNSQNSVRTVHSVPKNILQPEFNPKNNFGPKQ